MSRRSNNGVTKKPTYGKAMSIPHDNEMSSSDPNESWLQEVKRELIPNKVDWTTSAVNGRHIWADTDASGCHSNPDCKKSGPRKKCCACRIVVHQKCIEQLEQIDSCKCRPTFREAMPQGGIQPFPTHHVVHRKRQEGKCDHCGKAFQSMLSFQSGRDMVAVSCSWCKKAFHNKADCSRQMYYEKECFLGDHDSLVVPPSWIIKLPARKYSHAGSMNKKQRRVSRRRSSRERRAFVIKSVEEVNKTPLIVFVNPKSGGNQGLRILQKFQWLLNPRQVFDLSDGGPRFGIDLYRKVPNLRILVCGGDGTVGWILSELDRFKVTPSPPVAILPLGTGNDLSRFLGWGGGYTDEPLVKILSHLQEGDIQKFDRWDIDLRANQEATTADMEEGCNKLPLTVFNNYFSLGADAGVCLEFHESREANPERFNSRLKNLMFYGKAGGRTVLQKRTRDLHKCIDKLLCDGTDLMDFIRELKPVTLVFLNISKYAAGTSPWGHPGGTTFLPQSCDDGYLEVMGLTNTSTVSTQVGGHGVRIFQCKQAILVTNKAISMQVDGEPCRLKPSKIHLKQRNQVNMLFKRKHYRSNYQQCEEKYEEENLKHHDSSLKLFYITFHQYDRLVQYDTAEIKAIAEQLTTISIQRECSLNELRLRVHNLRLDDEKIQSKLSDSFCFLDATWTARVYRIDEAQESFMHAGDIIQDGVFILDLSRPDSLSAPIQLASRSQPNTPPHLHRPMSIPANMLSNQMSLPIDSLTLDNSDNESQQMSSIDSEDYSDISEEDTSPEMGSPEDLTRQLSPVGKVRLLSIHDGSLPESEEDKNKLFLEASKKGLLPQLLQLRASGISWTVSDSRGYTALHFASKYGQKDIVKHIIDEVPRAVLDLVDNGKGQTALHKAAYYQRRTICRMLVAAGASLTRLDLEGNSPRLMALLAADEELAKFLENQERLQIIAADDHETPV